MNDQPEIEAKTALSTISTEPTTQVSQSQENPLTLNNIVATQGSSAQTITPVEGDLTDFITGIYGKKNKDLVKRRDRETAMVFDGLVVEDHEYTVGIHDGYILANPPEFDRLNPDFRDLGLKIHVNIPTEDNEYIDKIRRVAELCLNKNGECKSTAFKVMFCSFSKGVAEYNPDQARKTITIYPSYLTGENTNVSETIRLVSGLRKIMGEKISLNNNGIFNEHNSGNGIYIRAGEFTKEGYKYQTVSKEDSFQNQLRGNLSSPRTDGKLFVEQVNDAIQKGLL